MQPEEGLDNQNIDNIMAQGVPERQATTEADSGTQSQNDKSDNSEKTKMSKKQIVGLVVLSLIALGGVLFGIYGMNSQNEQVAELKARAETAEGKVAELETEKVTITDPDSGTIEIVDDVEVATADTEGYIYIGEWGLKIKIPDDLTYVSYKFNSRPDEGTEILYINGTKGTRSSMPSFSNTSINDVWLVGLARYASDFDTSTIPGSGSAGELVYTDNGYNYYASGPQSVRSTNESDTELEVQSVNYILEVLRDPNSYSAI